MTDLSYIRTEMVPEQEPPLNQKGPIKWARENLFSGVTNSILTLLAIYFIYSVLAAVLPWIFQSSWTANSLGECRESIKASFGEHTEGACWAVIRERYLQLLFGFYPAELYWRPILGFILMLVAIVPILYDKLPRKMLWFSAVYPFLAFWLFWGGSIWVPMVTLFGFVIGGASMIFLPKYVGSLVATVAAILLPIIWWLVFAGPILDILVSGTPLPVILSDLFAILLAIMVYKKIREDCSTFELILTALAVFLVWSSFATPVIEARYSGAFASFDTNNAAALEPVESAQFGGFMLSIVIGVTGIALSLPIGILLALGRQSNLLIVKSICVGFIEFIRGVPLITLLFVASTLLNYFLPPGTTFDIILRVMIMVTLFSSAYMAEVIRGGLAALPRGQYEAADALGLDYWKAQRLIIMPQALKISIPSIVGNFIGLFKDTTLVSIIALMDPIGLSNAIRADQDWNGIVWELYGFIALMFFIFCFSMGRYAMYLEKKLKTGH